MNRRTQALVIIALATLAGGIWLFFSDFDEQIRPAPDDPTESAALSGRVLDTSGHPVAGAYVFAGAAAVQAGDDGRFSFAELPSEELPIDVTAEGYVRAGVGELGRPTVDLSGEQSVHGLELTVGRAGSLSGRVVAGGTPVEGATINLSYVYADGLDGKPLDPHIVSNLATTDGDGHFELTSIAPGRLQVFVDTDDHPFTESREIYFRPGRHVGGLVIDVAPTARLDGMVVSEEGEPLRAEVILTPRSLGGRARRQSTDEDGRFFFGRIQEGSYRLHAEADDYRPGTIEEFHIAGDGVSDLELVLAPRRGLYGRVVEPDGTPVPSARVIFEDRQGEVVERVRTNHQGRFDWADAPEGRFVAIAHSPAHQASQPTPITADDEVILEVSPGGLISGRVLDPRGQPVSEYELGVAYAEFDDDANYPTRQLPRGPITDEDGAFEFGPLRSGRYRLIVSTDDYAPATTDPIRVGPGRDAGPITVRLEDSASMSGIVVDRQTGEPVVDAQIYFTLNNPSNRPPNTRTDEQGRYHLEGLPAGRSSLRVIHDLYVHELVGGLEIPSGGHLQRDFELEPIGDGQPGQSVQGIGASLSRTDEGYRVQRLYDQGPARLAGMEEGDIISAVDDRDVDAMTLDQVVELIRGEPGTQVYMEVTQPGRGTRTVEIERQRVFMPQDRQVRGRR